MSDRLSKAAIGMSIITAAALFAYQSNYTDDQAKADQDRYQAQIEICEAGKVSSGVLAAFAQAEADAWGAAIDARSQTIRDPESTAAAVDAAKVAVAKYQRTVESAQATADRFTRRAARNCQAEIPKP